MKNCKTAEFGLKDYKTVENGSNTLVRFELRLNDCKLAEFGSRTISFRIIGFGSCLVQHFEVQFV